MRKQMSPMVQCQKEFAENDKDTLASAKAFAMRYSNNPDESSDWDILGDTEHHTDCEFIPPNSTNVVSSEFDVDVPIEDNFFDHISPLVEGHAEIINRFLADQHAPFHDTVKSNNIKFHD